MVWMSRWMQKRLHAEIGAMLSLTKEQIHEILSELFAEGMPKSVRRGMTGAQACFCLIGSSSCEVRGLTLEHLAHASDLSLSTLQHMRAQLSDPRLTTV